MKTTYELVIEMDCWPRRVVTVLTDFASHREARKEANNILGEFTTSERVRSRAIIHEIKHHSNPWRA